VIYEHAIAIFVLYALVPLNLLTYYTTYTKILPFVKKINTNNCLQNRPDKKQRREIPPFIIFI